MRRKWLTESVMSDAYIIADQQVGLSCINFFVFRQTHHITLAFQQEGNEWEAGDGGWWWWLGGWGWSGVTRISVLFFPWGAKICGSSGEGRAGAWEFRNHRICMLVRLILAMAWGKIMLKRDGKLWIWRIGAEANCRLFDPSLGFANPAWLAP